MTPKKKQIEVPKQQLMDEIDKWAEAIDYLYQTDRAGQAWELAMKLSLIAKDCQRETKHKEGVDAIRKKYPWLSKSKAGAAQG